MAKKKSILLVDDEQMIRDEFKLIFSETGYKLDVATNSIEGLHEIKSRCYNLVILDIKMPDINGQQSNRAGLDLLMEIRKIKPDIPVIMLTALDEATTATEAAKNGAVEYFVKDKFNARSIVEKCDEIIFLKPLEREIKRILTCRNQINMYHLYKELDSIEGLETARFKTILDKLEKDNKIKMDSQFNIKIKEKKGRM